MTALSTDGQQDDLFAGYKRAQRFDEVSATDRGLDGVVTCTIVRGEMLFGIARLPEGGRRSELEGTAHKFLGIFRCEPIPAQAGDFYAAVKFVRRQRGLVLDENDLWVAATALSIGATLVRTSFGKSTITGCCDLS